LATPAWAQPAQVLERSVNAVIRPAISAFESRAQALDSAMGDFCAAPSAEGRVLAEARFGEAARAYGAIEFLRIGPLMEDNRADRLLFWPDRRSIGLRQVETLIAGADESATEVANL